MNRSKSRIAAVMLIALACSGASKADTRALSTAGKVAITLATLVGATEIYNEVSAVVRKKQGKELNWYTGKYSIYNRFLNSEKNQTFKLTEKQQLVIQTMFKNVVNEGEEDNNIKRFKNFFNGEMLVSNNDNAKKNFEIFKKFLDGELEGKYEYDGEKLDITLGEKIFSVWALLSDSGEEKVRIWCDKLGVLNEK